VCGWVGGCMLVPLCVCVCVCSTIGRQALTLAGVAQAGVVVSNVKTFEEINEAATAQPPSPVPETRTQRAQRARERGRESERG
jgi:hypothetical protein